MANNRRLLDYVFESSWEICNKIGGIYTVLSTRARVLQEKFQDKLIFIGPDLQQKESNFFLEDQTLFSPWSAYAAQDGLHIRVGRWNVPGRPIVVLVDFKPFYAEKNEIYARLWEKYRVDSLHGYGDYDEASMFSLAAGKVVESFYRFYLDDSHRVLYHGNEWMTGLGLLYIKDKLPAVATLFTTHATSIGRSIAGNNKPLYEYFDHYHGDQMAEELNMQSKHSIEKQTARHVDCFTTVSEITAKECGQLLEKPVDFILPNGFEDDFVPRGDVFTNKRRVARRRLLRIANALYGETFDDSTLIVSTSGRNEFRNKGIDVFIDSIHGLRESRDLQRKVLALIEVPGWVAAPRLDLQQRLHAHTEYATPLELPVLTHGLHHQWDDSILRKLRQLNMTGQTGGNVRVIYIPCYLTGNDGIVDLAYYDLVLGNDLSVFPSYYEPWGYTPLESIAFKVPAITTDLAGFGCWVNGVMGRYGEIEDGVKVVHRTDTNYNEVVGEIENTIIGFSRKQVSETNGIRRKARQLSSKALWSKFIAYYEQAYDFALQKASLRKQK